MTTFWPLAANPWGEEERAAAIAVINSGRLTMGEKVREFEQAFAQYVGARHAVMVNSGSSANLLAIATLEAHEYLKDGRVIDEDEALVPAIAWPTTYAPLQQHRLSLRVVDVDLDTLNVSAPTLRANFDPSFTRILIGVSVLGNPAPLDWMANYAAGNGLWFIEDNCESMGATLNGRHCGTFGVMGTFSTFFSHHLSTGEGGMLVTNDSDLYDIAVCLRAHGWTRNLDDPNSLFDHKSVPDFDGAYHFILPGYNLRPTEIAAAAGLVQLRKLDEMNAVRARNWLYFHSLFSGNGRFRLQRVESGAVPFGFTMIAESPEDRTRASKTLLAAGIEHRMITGGCFACHPAAKHYDWSSAGLPNATQAHNCGFFVGNHPFALDAQIEKLKEVLLG